jgi:hypothetical protein
VESSEVVLLRLTTELPKDLKGIYEEIYRKFHDEEKAKAILSLGVSALRPLTLAELKTAWALYQTKNDGIPNENGSKDYLEPMPEITVRQICGAFVTVRDSNVSLVHQSAKEFLVSSETKATSKQYLDPVASNHELYPVPNVRGVY